MKVLSSTNILMSQGPRLPFQALPKAQKKKSFRNALVMKHVEPLISIRTDILIDKDFLLRYIWNHLKLETHVPRIKLIVGFCCP